MAKVKICGITNINDALFAARSGADYIGFIFAKSPRRVSPLTVKKIIKELPKRVRKVGVFVNENPKKINATAKFCKLDLVQLHGDESPEIVKKIKFDVIKVLRIRNKAGSESIKRYKKVFAILLDTYVKGKRGGTGKTFNWNIAKEIKKLGFKVFLSGGISPKNAKKAIKNVKPYAIDSSSGVEKAPGKKDPRKIKTLIRSAKA